MIIDYGILHNAPDILRCLDIVKKQILMIIILAKPYSFATCWLQFGLEKKFPMIFNEIKTATSVWYLLFSL